MRAGEALQKVLAKLSSWLEQLIWLLPNLVVAALVVVIFWLMARLIQNLIMQLLRRVSSVEEMNRLVATVVSFAIFAAGVFIALGICGTR